MQVLKHATPDTFKEQRAKDWEPLTAAELLVWIGITYKMGTLGKSRAAHYWSLDEDFGNDIIQVLLTII